MSDVFLKYLSSNYKMISEEDVKFPVLSCSVNCQGEMWPKA